MSEIEKLTYKLQTHAQYFLCLLYDNIEPAGSIRLWSLRSLFFGVDRYVKDYVPD